MKLNGRFIPFGEDRNENDPAKDFPIQEKVRDFSGKEREFEITYHELALGYIVTATETEKTRGEGGYEFTAFDSSSPYLALGKLRDKMRKALSTRYLFKSEGRYQPTHDTLQGRISTLDGQVAFVVDGIPLSLEQFGMIMSMHEGWEFTLKISDRCD